MSTGTPDRGAWPHASKLRRVLAIYLDLIVISSGWSIAHWALSTIIPGLEAVPFVAKLGGFLVIEILLLRQVKWSPGNDLLGIRLRLSDEYLASGQESLLRGTLVVEPRVTRAEAWWTILFGVLVILNGAKTAVRWTMFTPPPLVFGAQLPEEVSPPFYLAAGVLECLVGAAALRMRWYVAPLSVACFGLASLSALLSHDRLPGWIETYTHARRAYQGMPVRPGEVELMQTLAPMFLIVPLILLAWGLAVSLRVRWRSERT